MAKPARSRKRAAAVTVKDACAALARIAPPELAQSWDNVGLLAGHLDAPVRRALLCIDLMPAVVREAKRQRADLVVSYHPPLFRPVSRLVAPSERMEAGVLQCISMGAAVYALHTALDAAEGGTNWVLAAHVGLAQTEPLPATAIEGANGALEPAIGRVGALPPATTLGKLAARLRRRLGAACVGIVGDAAERLRRAIVVVGAAGDLPFSLDLGKGDVVVTGEIRHHDALRLLRNGACAVALSHWSSERPALDSVAARLQELLPSVRARISTADREPFSRA
ncbi:MAG: Nif3-like dinuclear metal center hexameric protein [Deltaproteobacteria bacterium]|jgi:dinuclear metal center YbgI/SA1388 family protein|nr:Nif3-like dinuclear metal center hexameric protein [Deltaproteobacteria bacterium]MBW2532979.1 Nif3-like dinuclear metal center hexameric protein [Deltaproteobacteria bacterium]